MAWTKDQLDEVLARNHSLAKLNAYTHSSLCCAKLEPSVAVASDAKDAGKAQSPTGVAGHAQIHVRITSRRRRLLDPDNLSAKALVDALRFAHLIPDDRPQDIALEVRQEKVASKSEECTVIEVW